MCQPGGDAIFKPTHVETRLKVCKKMQEVCRIGLEQGPFVARGHWLRLRHGTGFELAHFLHIKP